MTASDPKLSLDDEIARQRGLERDLLAEIVTSRARAWRLATISLLVALAAAIALATIFPLKEPPELWVARVDNSTGEVSHVTRLRDAQEDYGERIARYFVHQYVLACESYDWYTIQSYYNRCGLFSSSSVQRDYAKRFEGEKALDAQYGEHTRVRINVRSITLGPNQSATVRFTRRIERANQLAQTEFLIATLAYRYVEAELDEATGRENPLGFQVITYTTDVETQR